MAGEFTSRRALLKRGAVVGSVALWAPPVVQSLVVPAAAGTPAPPPPEPKRGFTFTLNSNFNQPVVTLRNDSDPTILITGLNWSIGDTSKNFDASVMEAGPMTFSQTSPDNNLNGGGRSNVVLYTFTGFDPGETFSFRVDIDRDNTDSTEDYRTVLFNNGAAANSTITVSFSTGSPIVFAIPDDPPPVGSAYSFSASS
jgi:hypothetical protein